MLSSEAGVSEPRPSDVAAAGQPVVPLGEVVLRVRLYHQAQRPAKVQQEFLVLGSQTLADLRDRIYCLADMAIDGASLATTARWGGVGRRGSPQTAAARAVACRRASVCPRVSLCAWAARGAVQTAVVRCVVVTARPVGCHRGAGPSDRDAFFFIEGVLYEDTRHFDSPDHPRLSDSVAHWAAGYCSPGCAHGLFLCSS